VILLVLAGWAALPWEWSTIDDPGFVLGMRDLWARDGILAPVSMFTQQLQGDLTWGLFRPSYWAYPAVVYSLPIGLAHAVRLGMVLVAIAGPLIALRRRGVTGVQLAFSAALLVAAGHALYTGLVFVSLQELSGAAFVGLGLALSHPRWRTVCWLIAAWFKSPFAWLLIGDAVVLWRRGKRGHALVSLALGAGTVVAAFLFSRSGDYTGAASLDYGALWRASQNLPKLLEPQSAAILVALVWWLVCTGSRLRPHGDALAVGIGWAGYVAIMLPWGVTSYYRGPMDYLLGVFLVMSLRPPAGAARSWQLWAGLTVPLVIASLLLVSNVADALRWNTTLKMITGCITADSDPLVLVSEDIGVEAPDRIEQNARVASPGWAGSVGLAVGGAAANEGAADLYVAFGDDPGPSASSPECTSSEARVYRLTSAPQ
jgi:hypothetical protein